jgi:hypothetical protein
MDGSGGDGWGLLERQLEEGKLRDNVDSLVPSRLGFARQTANCPTYHVHRIPQVIEIQYIRGQPKFSVDPGRGIVRATPLHGIHANRACDLDYDRGLSLELRRRKHGKKWRNCPSRCEAEPP